MAWWTIGTTLKDFLRMQCNSADREPGSLAEADPVPAGASACHLSGDPKPSIRLERPMIRPPNRNSTKPSSTSSANAVPRPTSGAKAAPGSKDVVQGEGNYEAAREFNESEREFVASGKVAAAARAAAPKSELELQAMFAAEEEGKRRAKE